MENNPESSIQHVFLEQSEQGHLVHDMKSPFNGIVGLTEPMAKMAKEPEKKKQLTWVNVSGARWCRYIEATVESAPLATGQVDLKAESINIGFLVEEACALMGVARDPREKLIKNEAVSLNNLVPLEGLVVTGSDPQTAKCLYHILLNALKFTDVGSINISHRLEGESHIVVSIVDTGIGMSPDQVESAFMPFVKFSDRYPGESLGLGLSSSREYLDFVGGKLTMQSELGKGTTAELWIPKQAANMGSHIKGPFGFGYFTGAIPLSGPWLNQKRALGILAVDLLPAHFGIAGMAEVLVANEPKPAAKKQLGMIQRSGNRVVEVLSLIRDATLRSEPSVVPESTVMNFNELAERICSELNKALDKRGQPMKKKTVEFLNEATCSPIVKTDPFYVYRVVYQLCDNALKFTAEGKVTLSSALSPERRLQISVADAGCGFDFGKLEDIFKPLHRLEPETYYGLGLGLNMVKDISDKLGASIEFKSEKGKGTSVVFLVGDCSTPLVDAPVIDPPVETVKEIPPEPVEPRVPEKVIPVEPVLVPPAPEIPCEKPPQEPVAVPEDKDPHVNFEEPMKVEPQTVQPATSKAEEPPKNTVSEPETLQIVYADMPKDEEDIADVKRKTLAGDKYRILVEMDDGSEPPSIQSALGNLSLALEILKERIAVANATSSNIKNLIKKIDENIF